MKIQRLFMGVLLVSMLAPLPALGASLSDIATSPNQTAIQYLYDNNIITGYSDGTFKPENTVNRAELLKILVGGKGVIPTVSQYHNCFPDVNTEWFAPYVCYAKAQNWVQGYPDNTFRPAQIVNKVEAIKMLVNSQGYTVPSLVSGPLFTDVQNSQWYAPYLLTAKDKGLLETSSGVYGVTDGMTRGEISENIYRAIIVKKYALETFTTNYNNPTTQPPSTQQSTPTTPPQTQYSHFSDGTYTVGKDIQPGTYRTKTASSGCYYVRLSGFGGTLQEIIGNSITDFPSIVTIAATDKGFQSTNCGTWTQDLSQITKSKTTFSDGMYIVGTDIQAGTYKSSGQNGCYYERLSNFNDAGTSGVISNAITDTAAIVTISATDAGFKSSNCGTWTLQ